MKRFALLALFVASAASAAVDPSLYNDLQWRLIGPFRGGRVLAVSGVAGEILVKIPRTAGKGGDITGGLQDVRQLLFRPTRMLYRTPLPGVYFCSASTPPGAGVHGMCGFHAARRALQDLGASESR